MKKPIYIFDLDGTTIDSSHRFTGTAEGKVNLAKWIEDSTRENIFKDTLLPLAKFMKALMKANQNVEKIMFDDNPTIRYELKKELGINTLHHNYLAL